MKWNSSGTSLSEYDPRKHIKPPLTNLSVIGLRHLLSTLYSYPIGLSKFLFDLLFHKIPRNFSRLHKGPQMFHYIFTSQHSLESRHELKFFLRSSGSKEYKPNWSQRRTPFSLTILNSHGPIHSLRTRLCVSLEELFLTHWMSKLRKFF